MADADVDAMSIKDMRALIVKAGLRHDDCLDKSDLRQRTREALVAMPPSSAGAEGAGTASESDSQSTKEFGTYQCIVKGPSDLISGAAGGGAPADLLVIGLHGLGASNTDLADMPSLLASSEATLRSARIVGVYPQAPFGAMGAAWWSFDVMSFMQATMATDPVQKNDLMAKLIRKQPDGVDTCRKNMKALITAARELAGGSAGPLPCKRVLLCGFSLGAITSLDVALQQGPDESVGGVVFMNGAPICVDQWAERLKVHKGLRAHLSAGQADMTLPCEATAWVKQLLDANGAAAEHKLHPGGHDIGGPMIISSISKFMARTLELAASS